MEKLDKSGTLPEVAAKLEIGHYHRHVFLCTGDKCCTAEVGAAAWDVLKKELKDRGLSLSTGPNACYRTKVNCLRICQGGPIAVVYPEGTWYAGLTAERIPLFVQQHLVEGQPVAEWVFANNPLPNPTDEPPSADFKSA
jgi:(2Fe-2S) ferredoxin